MSFARKRGGIWYLYWNVKVPDPAAPGGFRWAQRSKAVSPDRATFDAYRRKFDYTRTRARMGLPNDRMDWREFKARFLPHRKGKTLEVYEGAFRRFEAIAHPGLMGAFTYASAQAYRSALDAWVSPTRGARLSDTTKNMDIRSMRAAWAEAVRAGYVEKNVFAEVREFHTTKQRPRYLDRADLDKVLSEAKRSEADGAYLMALLIKYTGIRKSELLNLRWESFDLDRGHFFIRRSADWQPKDREENAIGLHGEVVRALRKRKAAAGASPYVFPGKAGGPRDKYSVGRLFNRIYKRAGVEARGLHILRHTFATHADLPEKVKQRILGHSDPRTTQRYVHITPAELEAVRNVQY